MNHQQRDFWQRARRAPQAHERRTHIALADRLRVGCRPDMLHVTPSGWWWTHFPAGEDRSEATGALLKRMGLRKGVFDFLFISPTGEMRWLELKRGLAPTTPEQDDFAAMCRERGIKHFIARSYEKAEAQLKEWGVL